MFKSRDSHRRFTFGDILASKSRIKEKTYTNPPTHCNICKQPITSAFVDGATRMGPWANMCIPCYEVYGVGLGTGAGQMYVHSREGTYVKVQG